MINQNKVVGYEFRQDSNQPWQKSGEHRRFEELVTAFNNRLINELKPYYQAATLDKGRTHLWEAKSFKQQYHALKGDALKTTILNDFKSKIVNCSSRQELEDAVENIRASNDFKILAQAQGLVTHHFNLKTSSVEALERIIEDKFTELRSSSQNSLK
ncbi:multifunctional virulence effector protein DrrA [Legionella waltersii]|uniref:Multifunctional virulence effector protein DrrA n=1 Tax=Legionella waltersii TaxID=66969 RepID=A0A0W1ABC9_9GAMM|nr:multifunctional virulence effector protein DrrA [Legionella waltersii]